MKADCMGPKDLERFIHASDIPGEILYLETPTPTVEAAAWAVGTLPERIVKSILFIVNEEPILVIACGFWRVDRRAVASYCQVGRKKVKLASPNAVLHETGFEVGAMPPFGHRYPLTTLMDKRVLEQPDVYAGGGAANALVHLDPTDILHITRAQVMDLIDPEQDQSARGIA